MTHYEQSMKSTNLLQANRTSSDANGEAKDASTKTFAINVVHDALKRGERLTSLRALKRYDVWSLAVAIHSLKKRGLPIKQRLIKLSNGKIVALYWIEDDA